MHKKTEDIITNLGFGDIVVKAIRKQTKSSPINRRAVSALKQLGMPRTALKQIKALEKGDSALLGKPNKEILEHLIKKSRRSLDSFSHKGVEAKVVFNAKSWTIYSEIYDKDIEKLQSICKLYFDECAKCGLKAILSFDGTQFWKVTTDKKADLPDNI